MITEVRFGDVVARSWSASLEDDEWIVEHDGKVVQAGISKKKALKLARHLAEKNLAHGT